MAIVGLSKDLLVNDPDLTPMRMLIYWQGQGRFKAKPELALPQWNAYDVQNIDSSELKWMWNNWDDAKAQYLDVWAEVPAGALDADVPVGFPDRDIFDEDGNIIGTKTWRERSNYIIKHDDATSAVMSMSPKDSNGNNLTGQNTHDVVKLFLDTVDGLASRTINNCYSGATDIATIKATYNPPEEV